MRSQTEVRDLLRQLAEEARPAPNYASQVLRRARRLRRRLRTVSISAAVLCVAVVASIVRLAGTTTAPQLVAVPPVGPFLGWTTAGDAANADLIRQAADAWNTAAHGSPGPHTSVRALLATDTRPVNSVVVLQGFDGRGSARLAFFTRNADAGGVLTLRADRPMPDPVRTRVVSLVSSRLMGFSGTPSSSYWGAYAIAVAQPGITKLQVASTVIDHTLTTSSGVNNGRFLVQELPVASTATMTSVSGLIGSREVFKVAADGGAFGDAEAARAVVLSRGERRLDVALPDGRAVRAGQFAVAASGLVGRVSAVDRSVNRATIELVTSEDFVGTAMTDISNVTGSVKGTGGGLVFQHGAATQAGNVNRGNRILVPDPAQRSDTTGAVTIGRAVRTMSMTDRQVQLAPVVDVAALREVSIMTPFADGTE